MKTEHEGTEAWRQGIRDSIKWIKYRQVILEVFQTEGYKAALDDALIHLEAMLERGTAKAVSKLDD